ncbi:MAG: hypothetical protein CO113_14050 [Elusimicrobia bacterium CG_4_9_14_3_um_filter_62_55]|nr:MAG: hypothetical protein COR54_19395 [Elusimicrobia bacterium CG22_combo_CG10-13_8_21_14_all_63_91]PJB24366.1 MAG: hypothetical protein CO113_14050 [Elusimicrobia bacterium CG_4_9_14_3_um_filter_62_55]
MGRNESFHNAVDVMRSAGVPFWVEQGTLLGLIREGRLIPWDHDIDFGAWNAPGAKDRIIQELCRHGFIVEELGPEYGCLHFLKTGSDMKIDVTLYSESEGHARTTFLVQVSGWRLSINRAAKLLGAEEPLDLLPKMRGHDWINKAGVLSAHVLHHVPHFVRKAFASPLLLLSKIFPCVMMCRWNLPAEFLLELRECVYGESRFLVPADDEGYLAFVYGKDWRTPRKNWIWWKEVGGVAMVPYREGRPC